MVVIIQNTQKADLQETKVNASKTRKICADRRINYAVVKNEDFNPNGLGSRSVVEVRQ